MFTASKTSLVVLCFVFFGQCVFAGSETPPDGPPWKTDFEDAQREALRTGKPIFAYFTKTY